MQQTISELIKDKTLIMKVVSSGDVIKYSLKERDFQGQRFPEKKGLKDFFEILTLTKPDILSEVYERFMKAGVDVVLTNTSKSNRYFLEKFGLSDITYELNLSSSKIARDKATKYSSISREKPRLVGGTLSNLIEDIDFNLAVEIYSEQAKALLAGKVDFLFLMDINDELSLKASLTAINSLMVRRDKVAEVLIALKNYKLFKLLKNYDFTSQFTNINFVASGFVLEFGENKLVKKINKLTKDNKDDILIVFNNTNFNEEPDEMIIIGTEFLENKNFKILGFLNNFSPEFIEKFYNINLKK